MSNYPQKSATEILGAVVIGIILVFPSIQMGELMKKT